MVRTADPLVDAAAHTGRVADDDVKPALRPLVWLVAAAWLPVRAAGRLGGRFLLWYDRTTTRASRALLRWLRALGRAIARIARPLAGMFSWLAHAARRARRWLVLQVFTPVSRMLSAVARPVVRRAAPAVAAADRAVRRLVIRLAPLARALGDRLAALGGVVARITRPVTAAARRFAGAVRRRVPGPGP